MNEPKWTDDDLSAMFGEINANIKLQKVRLAALAHVLVERKLISSEDLIAAMKAAAAAEETMDKQELQELAWDDELKNRPKQ